MTTTVKKFKVQRSKLKTSNVKSENALPMPSIGRIVHFVAERDGEIRAAIIVGVLSRTTVHLTVFGNHNDSLEFLWLEKAVHYGDDICQWHWPERV